MMSKTLKLTEENFSQQVLQSKVPVLVDFWSQSCGPCRQLAPVLDDLAEEYDGYAVIGKVNVAETPDLGAQFGIDMLPTLLLFHRGNVVERMSGMQTKEKLQDVLDEIDN
ncbi:MAG: thioredoxin [Planctomycetaceae bacterium]|jgi:thioredoxin 1|nr:thioredoxin [Planctomycetaceae bacterium]